MTPALLDSDTLTLLRKGNSHVVAHAASYVKQFGQLTISDLTYYEISRGLKAVGAFAQLARFEDSCRSHRILPFTHEATVCAADIWADLKRRGSLIGEMDTLIAGVALSQSLAVATRNISHFQRVKGVTVVDWSV